MIVLCFQLVGLEMSVAAEIINGCFGAAVNWYKDVFSDRYEMVAFVSVESGV